MVTHSFLNTHAPYMGYPEIVRRLSFRFCCFLYIACVLILLNGAVFVGIRLQSTCTTKS